MPETNGVPRLEMEQETTRIRGKEFEEWQRESAKIERNRARNAEVVAKQDLENVNTNNNSNINNK